MATTRYMLAKYAPDLARMEPRNIGVIVWHDGMFRTRFLDADAAIAAGVQDKATYERWIAYWSKQAAGTAVQPRRGKPVPADDPKCIDAFVSTQKGNYILVDAGELLKPARKAELNKVVAYLFDDLVATSKQKKRAAAKSLRQTCGEVVKRTGVEFKPREPVPCSWNGVTRVLHPDFYKGNGHPETILQVVDLQNEASVNSSALLIHSLISSGVVQRKACRFLVSSGDGLTDEAVAGRALCEEICGYVDVTSDGAVDEIREVAHGLTRASALRPSAP